MKILAFNASPRKNQGTTDIILNHFLEAATEAGATTKKHYITDLNINGCMGCFNCWTKTPGTCIHRDDMDWIIPEFGASDIIILATPIYNGNITHYLQQMTERLLPTALPYQVEDGETTRHPPRYQKKPPKIVLIATAGFPDHQAFNIAKALFPQALHITLPAAPLISNPETAKHIENFTEAVQKAAKLLVKEENVTPDLVERLNVQYNSEMKQIIRNQANTYFDANIEED
jgi:multimeric flavodoxin WrbA